MSLNLNGNVTGIYLGSTKADAVYLGNVKVFEDDPTVYETILGKQYPVVTIAGITIMAANLDYTDDSIEFNSTKSETAVVSNKKAWYYDRASTSEDGVYYGLKAMQYVLGLASGWHLVTKTEWGNIFKELNGGTSPSTAESVSSVREKIYSATGWVTPGLNTSKLNLGCYGSGYASGKNATVTWAKTSGSAEYSDGITYCLFTSTLDSGSLSSGAFSDIGKNVSHMYNSTSLSYGASSQYAFPIRLAKDA